MFRDRAELKTSSIIGLFASYYLLLVFPDYLQSAAERHGVGSFKWMCCLFTLLLATGYVVWVGVQVSQRFQKVNRPTVVQDIPKPSRFAIYFSLTLALASAFFLLPLGIKAMQKGIDTNNNHLIGSSIFTISLALYGTVKHVLVLKKGGVKGWIDERTRLRKV